MNSSLDNLIATAKSIAASKSIVWEIDLDSEGRARDGIGWNLSHIVRASTPPFHKLRDFGTDPKTIASLCDDPPLGPVREFRKEPLSRLWQDLLKACAIDQLLVRKNRCSHLLEQILRPLRVIATCAPGKEPFELSADDLALAMDVARRVQPSGKLADLVFGTAKCVLDANHVSAYCPLTPFLSRDKKVHERTANFAKVKTNLREDLLARKSAEKLPGSRAFWELTRIIFTEKPRSFLDFLRIEQAKVILLTGLRDIECTLLPAEWKRVREYRDRRGRPANESGGISRSYQIRNFAAKKRRDDEDSYVMYEDLQHIPAQFESELMASLDLVARTTEPLRKTLKTQSETDRILPQFGRDQVIPVTELYTFLTGNPFVLKMNDRERTTWIKRYQEAFDPTVFDDLRQQQAPGLRQGQHLETAVYVYFRRMGAITFRDRMGSPVPHPADQKTTWSELYLKIEEVESYLRKNVPTKLSDTTPFRLPDRELSPWELLFLSPKRSLADGREDALCDVTRCCSIGRMDESMIHIALGGSKGNEKQSLFYRYGLTEDDRNLAINAHSLRHLANTECFRLGLADTIITKRFNRRNLAQSHDYDHRNLAEDLDHVALPPGVEERLGQKTALVAKLIKSGKARGPIVEAFKRIQIREGDDAAIEYLRGEADGFLPTPYGHCITSLMKNPCPKHVECFNGCNRLSATDLSENRHNLVQLQTRLEVTVEMIEARKASLDRERQPLLNKEQDPDSSPSALMNPRTGRFVQRPIQNIGLENQLSHAKVRLEGVRKLLATPSGQLVFPDGRDLSLTEKWQRTVYDLKEGI